MQIIMKNPAEERTLNKWKYKEKVDDFEYNLTKKRFNQMVEGVKKLY